MNFNETDGKLQGKTIDYIEKQVTDGLTLKLRVKCTDDSTLDIKAVKSISLEDPMGASDPFLAVVTTLTPEPITLYKLEPLDVEGMIKEFEDPEVREALYVNSAFTYPDIDLLIAILKMHNM